MRWLLQVVAILIVTAMVAAAQQNDVNAAADSSLKYQISATLTDYCPVERTLPLHEVMFDFHNKSCSARRHVAERKTPTLPNGPLYTNVHIAGYQLIDWSEGHPSPSTRNTAKVEISKTATTLSAAGWLEKATCTEGSKGDVLAEDTFWQAKVVPEVQLIEDVEQEETAVIAELVPPQTTAVLQLSATCGSDRPQQLRYSVAPIVDGVAQAPVYNDELKAHETAHESGLDGGAASIHSQWSSLPSKGASELSITINGKGVKEPANSPAP
ncbi:MAG TPA: hypothetical protein VNY51_03705 [Candidatus Dormibacteraeota bacterium]|nr:hypothetical protein [Candidatus Dormibacteraeota bacterium]